MRTYSLYIMASESGVLYTGVTNNLERRAAQHRGKLVPGFTARYNVHKLVYYELYGDVRQAITREKQIKGWLRKRKVALIESRNPSWKDLVLELEKARSGSLRNPSTPREILRPASGSRLPIGIEQLQRFLRRHPHAVKFTLTDSVFRRSRPVRPVCDALAEHSMQPPAAATKHKPEDPVLPKPEVFLPTRRFSKSRIF